MPSLESAIRFFSGRENKSGGFRADFASIELLCGCAIARLVLRSRCMTPEEKKQLLAEMGRGEEALAKAVKSFSEADASVRPALDRWSALECVEHLVLAEEYLLGRVLAGKPEGSTNIGRDREAIISAVGLDRTRQVASPGAARPRGRFRTLAEATKGFHEARKQTLEFVQSCEQDLRSRFTTHPIVPNVNCWEVLLMIAVHPSRHAEQISEIAELLRSRKSA
jgi:DinB superfamily